MSECLKFSSKSKPSQCPPLEMIAGDTSTWKPTWISLPYSGPMVFGFLPLVHTGRGLQGLHLGQVRIKNGSPRDRQIEV